MSPVYEMLEQLAMQPDLIFTFFLFVACVGFLACEAISFVKNARRGEFIRRPWTASVGWNLVPAIFLVFLVFVHWQHRGHREARQVTPVSSEVR